MIMHRRKFLLSAAAAIGAPAICTPAWAQNYPARPVRIIVGFPAGGLTDITARLIAQRLSDQLGQQFIVENRPGAVTNLATEAVVRAPADGYTLLLTNSMNAINTTLYDRLNYDFIRDVAPVASIVDAAFILEVNPSIPAKTFPEFIAYAKANPDKLSYASSGPGGIEHVVTELFMMRTGIKMLHVPYRGTSSGDELLRNITSRCSGVIAEFPQDTTRAITNLLFTGIFARFKDIRFIFTHAGGYVPMMLGRMHQYAPRNITEIVPNGIESELKRHYYDIAGTAYRPAIAALTSLVPTTHILFGSDNPYVPLAETAEGMLQVGFSVADLQLIGRDNALALLPRLNKG